MITAQDKAAEILRRVELAAISLSGEGAGPHIFTAFVAPDEDLDLRFVSQPGSQHARLCGAGCTAAAALYNSQQGWDDWKEGIQIWGRLAKVPVGREAGRDEIYERRFPAYRAWAEAHKQEVAQNEVFILRWERMVVLGEEEWGEEEFRTVQRRTRGWRKNR